MITNRTRRNRPFKQALLPITKETVEEGNDSSWSTTDINQVTIRKEQDPFLNVANLLSEWENVHPPKVKIFYKKFGGTKTSSSSSVNTGRVQNTFHRGANTISITSKSSFQFGAKTLIYQEVQVMLRKGAIQKAQALEGQFLSNLFLVKKKDGGIAQ